MNTYDLHESILSKHLMSSCSTHPDPKHPRSWLFGSQTPKTSQNISRGEAGRPKFTPVPKAAMRRLQRLAESVEVTDPGEAPSADQR